MMSRCVSRGCSRYRFQTADAPERHRARRSRAETLRPASDQSLSVRFPDDGSPTFGGNEQCDPNGPRPPRPRSTERTAIGIEDPARSATYRNDRTHRPIARNYESGHREKVPGGGGRKRPRTPARRRLYRPTKVHEPIGTKDVEKQCEECGFGLRNPRALEDQEIGL